MHLVAWSHLRWDFVYQRPQHLLSRFARDGWDVTFVEEPTEGEPRLERTVPMPGVTVIRPRVPGALTREEREGLTRALLDVHWRDADVRDPVLWFHTPMALPLADGLRARAVVYDCMDELYEKFFENYTRKQWGLDPSQLDASVTARVPVRTDRDPRYFSDRHQAMPLHGYTRMFQRMLAHPNIEVMLGTDFRDVVGSIEHREVIYTGPIDEYFGHRFGPLPYRSLDFRHEVLDTEVAQPAPVVNYPNEHAFTRITEFKYLTGQRHERTAVVYEYPKPDGDPYYPIPRPENAELYRRYKALAEETPRVHFVGRLGTYRYYNMNQVVAQALTTFRELVGLRTRKGAAGADLVHRRRPGAEAGVAAPAGPRARLRERRDGGRRGNGLSPSLSFRDRLRAARPSSSMRLLDRRPFTSRIRFPAAKLLGQSTVFRSVVARGNFGQRLSLQEGRPRKSRCFDATFPTSPTKHPRRAPWHCGDGGGSNSPSKTIERSASTKPVRRT